MSIETTKNMHEQLVSQTPSEIVSQMTNREWLQSLSDEDFGQFLLDAYPDCLDCYATDICEADGETPCKVFMAKWLKAEHKEVSE